MRHLLVGLLLLAGGVLSSCAAVGPANLGTFEPVMSTREFAGPETYLAPTPTALVVLKAGQDSRNLSFCEGYLTLASTQDMSAASVVPEASVPLRWMMKTNPQQPPSGCQAILAGYDFARAATLTAALAAQDGAPSFAGTGPFIIEFMPDGSSLVLDGSNRSNVMLRQFAPQWLLLTGTPIGATAQAPDSCFLMAVGLSGTMAARGKALLDCELPNGFDIQVITLLSCAALDGLRSAAGTFNPVSIAAAVGQAAICQDA